MPNVAFTPADLQDAAEAFRRNSLNVSATARSLGIPRQTMQHRLRKAHEASILSDEEMRDPNAPNRDEYLSARSRMLQTHQNKERKGDWRKPVLAALPDRPFRLKLFGDPHLDDDAADYALFERHWLEMDAEAGVYGVCIGDWFNNWLKALAHLWKQEGDPSDAWTCLTWLMEERGDALIATCSGNHDDWSHGPVDPVAELMRRHGVIYRKGAVRVLLSCGDNAPVRLALRHKWRGHSMYSPAHGIRRAAEKGWLDHVMVGGHIHQDEPRMYVHPDSGFVGHICQISAFKEFDEFADVHGFMPHRISPVWDLVIDPRASDGSPDKVKVFWDSERAAAYLAALR